MFITVISHPFLAVGVFHRSYTFGCGVALAMDIVGHRALKSKIWITFISARVVAYIRVKLVTVMLSIRWPKSITG
jgi:hypothetical protein